MDKLSYTLVGLRKMAKDNRKRYLIVRMDKEEKDSFWVYPDQPENVPLTLDDYGLPFFILKEVEMSGAV